LGAEKRAALMPTLEQIEEASRIVEQAEARLKGILAIDYVVPDYYALRPKKCMGAGAGSSSTFLRRPDPACTPPNPLPARIPVGAVKSLDRLDLAKLGSFNRYRGTGWMPSRAKAASSGRSTSAVAAARPSR